MGEKPNPNTNMIGFGAPNPKIMSERSSPKPKPLDPIPAPLSFLVAEDRGPQTSASAFSKSVFFICAIAIFGVMRYVITIHLF